MSDLTPDPPATELRIAVTTAEPAQIRIDFNAVSKAIANYITRLVRSGWLALLREQCGDGGCPLALIVALLDFVKARDSAKILTQTGRIIVWPTHRTLQSRSGYGRAAVFNALLKLEAMGCVKRLEMGGGRDSTTFELLPPPDEDSPVYWGGRVGLPDPSTRIDRYARAGVDGCPSMGVDGTGLPNQTADDLPGGPLPSVRVDQNLRGKDNITFPTNKQQHTGDGGNTPPLPAAIADGVAERMAAEGLPGYRVDELAGAPWQTLDYVNACAREAAAAHPGDNRKRVGLLIFLLGAPDRCSRPRKRQPDRAATDAAGRSAENSAAVAKLATGQREQARIIRELADAGKLADAVRECIDNAPAEILRVQWSRVDPSDPAAVAKSSTLAAVVCERALQMPAEVLSHQWQNR